MAQGIVIYDDRCGFCRRSVRLLRALDRGGKHQYEGSSNEALLAALGISASETDEELKLSMNGQLYGGYDAVVEALGALPLTFWLAPLMRLAPIRWLGRKVYRSIARNRKCTYNWDAPGR